MIESDRKMFQLTLFGLGVALALNTGSAAATERDCVDSATAIISEIAEKVDPSNGRIDARREAQKLCSLRISPQMRGSLTGLLLLETTLCGLRQFCAILAD